MSDSRRPSRITALAAQNQQRAQRQPARHYTLTLRKLERAVRQRCRTVPVLAYRLGMPARKRPTPEDTAAARRILLDGLARDTDIFDLAGELAPLHPRNNTFPGEVFLHLAADALDWCGASRTDPLSLAGIRDRFLPEGTFRGRQNNN